MTENVAHPACALGHARQELQFASRLLGQDLYQVLLSVPDIHCGSCIRTIENNLIKVPSVDHVRVNLTTKRVAVKWRGAEPPDLVYALNRLGFKAHLAETDGGAAKDATLAYLLRALAVSGFAAMNIMLLSVSVWSGADSQTRHVFHLISAVLALPCLIYAGRIFFASAWSALRHGQTNMDVPISIGLLLTFSMSLYDVFHNEQHAYFDAVTSLIFFLLIGRTLDHLMRDKARKAVTDLMRMMPRSATVLDDDGMRRQVPVSTIRPGMRLCLAAGDRVAVDGIVQDGNSDVDCSMITGESIPQPVQIGSKLCAGALNLSGALVVTVSAGAADSFLSEMVRLMETAEKSRAPYRRLADRAAALYVPVVHIAAFLAFLGWHIGGGDWHHSVTIAIAVLIITCPCALGLAVPIVQVVASRRLFEKGILIKDGSALERMAEIDMVVFDKTGTLTAVSPRLLHTENLSQDACQIAAKIAQHSNHPLSRAIVNTFAVADIVLADVHEYPGFGVEARIEDDLYRLGRAEWALANGESSSNSSTVLSRNGHLAVKFTFAHALRSNAASALDALRCFTGLKIVILSGDTQKTVLGVAEELKTKDFFANLLPREKMEKLQQFAMGGHKVLMVGDGLNDVPALATAHVSMAPAEAADVGRNAADFVFLGESLNAVPIAISISREAKKLVRQNFILAAAYNGIALPMAVAGYVTPLVAAIAMSASSIIVVANALRLHAGKPLIGNGLKERSIESRRRDM